MVYHLAPERNCWECIAVFLVGSGGVMRCNLREGIVLGLGLDRGFDDRNGAEELKPVSDSYQQHSISQYPKKSTVYIVVGTKSVGHTDEHTELSAAAPAATPRLPPFGPRMTPPPLQAQWVSRPTARPWDPESNSPCEVDLTHLEHQDHNSRPQNPHPISLPS